MYLLLLTFFNAFFLFAHEAEAKLKERECEVCIKLLNRFVENTDSKLLQTPDSIQTEFKRFCKNARGREESFCFYLGALETSATNIMPEMSKPLSWGVPVVKVCEKLKSKDLQLCELKYDKAIDLTKVKLTKLKVKDLKKILSEWGEDQACKGCAEKSDFIAVIKDLMPQYAPEAAAVLRAKQEL